MLGTIIKGYGQLVNNDSLMLVHIDLKQGKSIPAHDHVGQDVYFTLVKGAVQITLDSNEVHTLHANEVLQFDGTHTISVDALEDSEFFVYLINR